MLPTNTWVSPAHMFAKSWLLPTELIVGNPHYNDVIMSAMASQITSVSNVCSIVGPVADQRKHQSFASLAFVLGIHRWPANSPHKRQVTWKMFPFDDVIMSTTDVGHITCVPSVLPTIPITNRMKYFGPLIDVQGYNFMVSHGQKEWVFISISLRPYW